MHSIDSAPVATQTQPKSVAFARKLFELFVPSNASDIVSEHAPEQFVQKGAIVLTNIGKTCTEQCQPHYATVTSDAYFANSDASMIAYDVNRFDLDDIAEPFVILKRNSTGEWQKTGRSLQVGEAIVDDISEYTA